MFWEICLSSVFESVTWDYHVLQQVSLVYHNNGKLGESKGVEVTKKSHNALFNVLSIKQTEFKLISEFKVFVMSYTHFYVFIKHHSYSLIPLQPGWLDFLLSCIHWMLLIHLLFDN